MLVTVRSEPWPKASPSAYTFAAFNVAVSCESTYVVAAFSANVFVTFEAKSASLPRAAASSASVFSASGALFRIPAICASTYVLFAASVPVTGDATLITAFPFASILPPNVIGSCLPLLLICLLPEPYYLLH